MAASRADARRRATAAARVPLGPGMWTAAAVVVALGVRLVVLYQLQGHPLLRPSAVLDDAEYLRLAQRAAAGDWALGPGAYHVSPLYIYFLAVVFRVSGAVALHAQVVQALLGAAAVALVAVCARRLVSPGAAVVSAFLAALAGVLVFHEVLLLQSALDPFLAALALERLAAALERPSTVRHLAAGAAFGLLGLNRPNALLALALVVVAALVTARSRRAAAFALTLAAGGVLALAPVAVRNRVVTGEWLLVASHGGLNFAIGNSATADGAYQAPAGVAPTIEGQAADTRRLAEAAAGRSLTDAEVSGHFYGQGWSWIRGHPGAAARLFAKKLLLTLSAVELPLNYAYAYWSRDEPTLLRVLVVGPWLLVPLGLAGLFVPWRVEARARIVWASFVPAYAVAVAVFFVASRYRLPLVVALCVTGGAAAEWLFRAASARRAERWRAVAAAFVVGVVVAHWPWRMDDGLAHERTERLVHLVAEGRHDEARALLARTAPIHRDPGLLHYRVGRAWLDAGQNDAAAAELEQSLAAVPAQGEVHLALGQALLRSNKPAEAAIHLERARAAGAFLDVAGLDLARARLAEGQPEAARAAVAATPILADTDLPTITALGVLAVNLKDLATARRFLEEARRRAPESGDVHYNLALLSLREGRIDEARALARRALELDPASSAARSLLADLTRP